MIFCCSLFAVVKFYAMNPFVACELIILLHCLHQVKWSLLCQHSMQ